MLISTHAQYLWEIMPPISVKNTKEKSIEDTNTKFTWGVEKGHELTKFNQNFKWT